MPFTTSAFIKSPELRDHDGVFQVSLHPLQALDALVASVPAIFNFFFEMFHIFWILVELSFSNGKKGNKFTHLKIRSNSSYFWSFFCTKYSSASSYSLSGVAGASSLANMKGSINKPVLNNSEEHADVVPRCEIIEVKKK